MPKLGNPYPFLKGSPNLYSGKTTTGTNEGLEDWRTTKILLQEGIEKVKMFFFP